MELPCEIWEKIIVQIKDVKQCVKLFKALPKITQNNIHSIFVKHIESIQIKILYSLENYVFLAIEDKRIIIQMENNDIQQLRIMNDGNYVSVDIKGKIIFWDHKKYKYIDCVEIESEIHNIEFHPTESRMIVSLIRENLGLEIQSIHFKKNGIDFNQTLIAYEPEFLIEIVYHPIISYILIIRHKNSQIYSVYLWNYNQTIDGDELEYSDFERIEYPFIINFGIDYIDNFIYIYYLPFKILENGDFECLGKGISYYYILKMGISNNKFYLKENQRFLYSNCRQIFDYVRYNDKLIYIVNGYKIIQQDKGNIKIIYENHGEPISRLTLKHNYIIFLENHMFKKIDLDKFDRIEEIIDCKKIPSDFCVL